MACQEYRVTIEGSQEVKSETHRGQAMEDLGGHPKVSTGSSR